MGFPGNSAVKNLPENGGDASSIPGSGRSPEEEMATHYSILTWEIPWTKEFISSLTKKVGHDLATRKQQQAISYKGNSEFVSNIKP